MLAFSQVPVHTTPMLKTVTRILLPGTPDQTVISITPHGETGTLEVNGSVYHLDPRWLPDVESVQRLLAFEKVATYLVVVDMLREMVA